MVVVASAALCAVAGVAGCSSKPGTSPQPPGSLPVSTAQITVNGKSVGPTNALRCTQDGWLHTFETGDEKSSMRVVVDAKNGLTAPSVQLKNVGDFTGSVWENNIGKAEATVIGTTFRVNGTAVGATTDNPNQEATASFDIKVNC